MRGVTPSYVMKAVRKPRRKPRKKRKPRKNTMKLWQLLPVPILLLSSACALGSTAPAPMQPIRTHNLCRLTAPMTYDSVADSPETVAQVEAFNAVWLSLCEPASP